MFQNNDTNEESLTSPSDPVPKDDREAAILKNANLHRRCADPHLLALLSCLRDENLKKRDMIIGHVGEDKFRQLLEDRDRNEMAEKGYEFVKAREQAQEKTEVLVEVFREREGLPSPPTPAVTQEGGKSWWQFWKSEGGLAGEAPLTEEQLQRKEELRAVANDILNNMRQAREEKEVADAAAARVQTEEKGEGGGGSKWWRFGL